MALIGVVSAKGSPGVSTIAMELVRRWPRDVVGIELDPSGGSWALRHDLSWDPGVVSLAATPGPISIDTALEHGQRVGANGVAICASPFGDQVRASLDLLEPRLASWHDSLDGIIDVGRFDQATAGVLRRCDLVVVVTRTRIEDIGQLQRLADTLRLSGVDVWLLAVGAEEYGAREVAEEVHLPLIDVSLPMGGRPRAWDRAAQLLCDTLASRAAVASVPAATVAAFGQRLSADRAPVDSAGEWS